MSRAAAARGTAAHSVAATGHRQLPAVDVTFAARLHW